MLNDAQVEHFGANLIGLLPILFWNFTFVEPFRCFDGPAKVIDDTAAPQ